ERFSRSSQALEGRPRPSPELELVARGQDQEPVVGENRHALEVAPLQVLERRRHEAPIQLPQRYPTRFHYQHHTASIGCIQLWRKRLSFPAAQAPQALQVAVGSERTR